MIDLAAEVRAELAAEIAKRVADESDAELLCPRCGERGGFDGCRDWDCPGEGGAEDALLRARKFRIALDIINDDGDRYQRQRARAIERYELARAARNGPEA